MRAGQSICEDEIMDSCHGHRVNAVAVEDSAVVEFPVAWLKESAQKQAPLHSICFPCSPTGRI